MKSLITNTDGITGIHGSNSDMYSNQCIRNAAKEVQQAISFYFYGYSYKRGEIKIPGNHPLCKVLKLLAKADKLTCESANKKHNPEMFKLQN